MSLIRWQTTTALVTGASSGFGLAIAKGLARKGATVIAVARREAKLKAIVDDLGGPPHSYSLCDVSDLDQVRGLAKETSERLHHLDILVNNAGIPTSGPLGETTSEDMARVIRTNLLGAMWCTRELLPLLDAAPRSARLPIVVNVASIAGRLAAPSSPDYTASKFGLVGFTESVWHDLHPKGIRTMMVNPGGASTEGFDLRELRQSKLFSWTVMETDRVARALIGGVERGSFEVRVQWWLHPLYHFAVMIGPLRKYLAGFIRKQLPGEF